MSHGTVTQLHLHSDVPHRHRENFSIRFKKNLILELKRVVSFLKLVYAVTMSAFIGILVFLFTFKPVGEYFKFIKIPIIVYLVANYLSSMPFYLVVIATCASLLYKNYVIPLVLVVVLATFFRIFLI